MFKYKMKSSSPLTSSTDCKQPAKRPRLLEHHPEPVTSSHVNLDEEIKDEKSAMQDQMNMLKNERDAIDHKIACLQFMLVEIEHECCEEDNQSPYSSIIASEKIARDVKEAEKTHARDVKKEAEKICAKYVKKAEKMIARNAKKAEKMIARDAKKAEKIRDQIKKVEKKKKLK